LAAAATAASGSLTCARDARVSASARRSAAWRWQIRRSGVAPTLAGRRDRRRARPRPPGVGTHQHERRKCCADEASRLDGSLVVQLRAVSRLAESLGQQDAQHHAALQLRRRALLGLARRGARAHEAGGAAQRPHSRSLLAREARRSSAQLRAHRARLHRVHGYPTGGVL
jgi:hypothetical protein